LPYRFAPPGSSFAPVQQSFTLPVADPEAISEHLSPQVTGAVLQVTRAYERGVREVHCTWARYVQGPGKVKVRRLRFSVTKPKLMVALPISSAGTVTSFPSKILTNTKLKF